MRSMFSVSTFFMCVRECASGMSSYHLCGKSVVGCTTDRVRYRIACIRGLVDWGVTDRVRHRMQCEKSIVGDRTDRVRYRIAGDSFDWRTGKRRETLRTIVCRRRDIFMFTGIILIPEIAEKKRS